MVVHVNEMHADVRPGDAPPRPTTDAPAADGRTPDEVWREERGWVEFLRRRTAAEGFDD